MTNHQENLESKEVSNIVEMFVTAPPELDNSESIKMLNDEMREELKLIVGFYFPPPRLEVVKQNDGTWPLRIVGLKKKPEKLDQVKEFLLKKGFAITQERAID